MATNLTLGGGRADITSQLNPFGNIVGPIHENKPFKKKMTLVLRSFDAPNPNPVEDIPNNTQTWTFNVSVPDGNIQSNSHLYVESFQMVNVPPLPSGATVSNGFFEIRSPDFNIVYSYDSATHNQATTLVAFQGSSYHSSIENYIVLRDAMFLTSKNIRIQIAANDNLTFLDIYSWILILTIIEV